MLQLQFRRVALRKRYPLRISRGVSYGSENLFVSVTDGALCGLGELAGTDTPGGENADTGTAELTRFWATGAGDLAIAEVWSRARAAGVRPRALAALDMALWDLFAKRCGQPLYRVFGLARSSPATSVTLGICSPAEARERVPEILARTCGRFLKIKLGSPDGLEADRAMFAAAAAAAAPFGVGVRVDANGGWSPAGARDMLRWLAARGVEYVEQPLARGAEAHLPELFRDRPLPLFVDESCDVAADVPALADRVDGINVKLMKCGGPTEALRLVAVARAHGLKTMIGCMSEAHVAISAGAALGALFDFIDLDSQLNLVDDPTAGAVLVDGVVVSPERPGHGGRFRDA